MVREEPVDLCPACGTRGRSGARFCAVCGAAMSSAAALPALAGPLTSGDNGAPLAIVEVHGLAYLGGLDDLPAERRTVSVIIGEDGVGIYRRRRELLLIDDDMILGLRVYEQGPDTLLEVHTNRGIGRFKGLDGWDLAVLEPYLLRRPPAAAPTRSPASSRAPIPSPLTAAPMLVTPPTPAELSADDTAPSESHALRRARLQELRALHDDGLIPIDEYQRRCAEIIAEI